MAKVAHVIGNGDSASFYKPAKGIKVTCNLPPFAVENVYTTCMVDFKMMAAINEGSVEVPGEWTLGFRPKKWMEMKPNFYMKYAKHVKDFYTVLPSYVKNYTDFNCGHMAVHMTANKFKAEEIHMYGFDSILDMNLRSSTDFYLNSDREAHNNVRLADNWRPVWQNMFKEFIDKKFVIHHKHNSVKIPLPDNVEIFVNKK
jgi:hypothetical protein